MAVYSINTVRSFGGFNTARCTVRFTVTVHIDGSACGVRRILPPWVDLYVFYAARTVQYSMIVGHRVRAVGSLTHDTLIATISLLAVPSSVCSAGTCDDEVIRCAFALLQNDSLVLAFVSSLLIAIKEQHRSSGVHTATESWGMTFSTGIQ